MIPVARFYIFINATEKKGKTNWIKAFNISSAGACESIKVSKSIFLGETLHLHAHNFYFLFAPRTLNTILINQNHT